MSYILDALRKADAERERGSVPGIHAQPLAAVPPLDPTSRIGGFGGLAGGMQQRWLIGGAAAGLTVVLALVLLQMTTHDPAAASSTRTTPAEPVARSAAEPSPAEPSPAVPRPEPSRPAPAAPPAAYADAPAFAPVPAPPVAAAPSRRPEPATPPVQAPALARVPALAPEAAAPSPDAARPMSAGGAPSRATAATAAIMGTTSSTATDTTTTASTAAAAAAQATADSRIYQTRELPDDIRRELPILTVGGATYSENPASRMLIINGQVFHENDKLAPELVLERIQLRSAVLRYKGLRYAIAY